MYTVVVWSEQICILHNHTYRTRSKNSPTPIFVRKKSCVQVDSNSCHKALKFVRRKVLFEWTLIVTNFWFLYPRLYRGACEHKRYVRKLTIKVSKYCTCMCMYCSAYFHKLLLQTCPPCSCRQSYSSSTVGTRPFKQAKVSNKATLNFRCHSNVSPE